MKHQTTLAIPVLLLVLAACKSSGGTEAASSTVGDLKALQTELVRGEECISVAVATLTELAAEGGDMAAEYKAYCKAVDGVQAQRETVRSVQARLTERRTAFIASWNEGLVKIQDASMRERAEERRDEVVSELDELKASGDEARTEIDEWVSSLVDVRTYLEHDLNPSGVASVKKDVKSIEKRGKKISETLNDYASKLDEVVKQLEAAKPEPAPKAGA